MIVFPTGSREYDTDEAPLGLKKDAGMGMGWGDVKCSRGAWVRVDLQATSWIATTTTTTPNGTVVRWFLITVIYTIRILPAIESLD